MTKKYFIEDPFLFKAIRFVDAIVKGGKTLVDAFIISARYYNVDADKLQYEYEKFHGEKNSSTTSKNQCPTCTTKSVTIEPTEIIAEDDKEWTE